jgi:hypothetical protein
MMKYLIFCIALISLYSCARTNSVAPPAPPVDSTKTVAPAPTPLIDSMYIYSLGHKEINYSKWKFNYDARGRLAGFYTTDADSGFTGGVFPDTSFYTFNYQGTDSLPYAYTIFDNVNRVLSPDGTYHHTLSYDDLGRVLTDTESVAQAADHYNYLNGFFTMQNRYNLDSFYFADGNLSSYVFPFEKHIFTYSAYANPTYFPQFGIQFSNILPFPISQKLFSRHEKIYSAEAYTINYSWTTNEEGRVTYGVGIEESTGLPLEYYWFVYKK